MVTQQGGRKIVMQFDIFGLRPLLGRSHTYDSWHQHQERRLMRERPHRDASPGQPLSGK
jgi:hypothetical protein